jgi:VWFA-related protein
LLAKFLAIALTGWLIAPRQQEQIVTPADEDPPAVIKVDVSVVNVLAAVRDNRGRLVSTLEKADFEIREEGKPQPIVYFAKETTQPLTLGLLVDSSGSQINLIEEERKAAGDFLRQIMTPRDAAFLISFDMSVDLLADVTANVGRLTDALGRIEADPPLPPTPGPLPPIRITGGTHLYDAVYLASMDVLQREAGRKAIILISDGQDQGSQVSRDRAIEAAQRTDVIIYGILFVDRAFYGYGNSRYDGDAVMRRMAEETGGRTFRATSEQELAMAFDQISEELRSQYSIGYEPVNQAKDGSYRRIDVRVRGRGLRIQARKGYYAPQQYPAAVR